MSKLQIYKASAGSGKTYLLTLNYLKTAFKAPDRFTKILAVTFTNKAAEEMKTRILEKLDELIKKGKNADYFKEIKQSGQYKTDNELIKNAETIRDNILHDYSAFNVGTIDSFVQKVIRAFAFEMNLNSSYEIEFDTDKVTEDLTNKLYEKISFDRDLQKWLLQYAQNKTENNKNWDFKNEIKNLTSEIFKEQFLELYKNRKIEKKEMNDFLKTLYKIKNNFESKMSELAAKYKKILEDAAMNPGTYGMKFKIISNHFLVKTAIKKEYDNFTATFIKARDGIENWYAKSASAQIINDIKNTYEKLYPLIETYFKYFEAESENYYTATEIIKQFHAFGIINDMAAELSEYRSENNILLISDTNLLLKEIIGNNDAPFIYEKTGTGFYNIFIDEFQDTSNFQWANFKPLITNSLSQGYTNLIVGDIKQSVYRWRGGDWKLLLQGVKQDIGKEFSEEKTL
ncbi:MAG: UvrD-helicase domain-containing protein, partial [Chlorobi bacterium]|nr:UvrD-helicase domain-containing protein [Chlorobiota bacterium]